MEVSHIVLIIVFLSVCVFCVVFLLFLFFFVFWLSGFDTLVEDALIDTNKPCFRQPPRAFSVIFGKVPKQSEISKILGDRICRSPRRGLIRNQFVSSSCYGLHTNTFKKHLHGNRRLFVIFFQYYQRCFYSKKNNLATFLIMFL